MSGDGVIRYNKCYSFFFGWVGGISYISMRPSSSLL